MAKESQWSGVEEQTTELNASLLSNFGYPYASYQGILYKDYINVTYYSAVTK
jgi:hypothetical protein